MYLEAIELRVAKKTTSRESVHGPSLRFFRFPQLPRSSLFYPYAVYCGNPFTSKMVQFKAAAAALLTLGATTA